MPTPWPQVRQVDPLHVKFESRTLVYFGGCDYLRLSWHPDVRRALSTGLKRHGLNVAASRGTTGNHPLYPQLEERLAGFFGCEDAILVSNGYMASLAVGQAMAGPFTHALLDAKAHACLRDAACLMGIGISESPHGTALSASALDRKTGRHSKVMVMTDGMFSQNGFVAPLREWSRSLRRGDWLLVDDAHGVGVLGENGRGAVEWTNTRHPRLLLTATLSKAFGVYGGMILGPSRALDGIRSKSRMLLGNTPLPLPLVEAAMTSLRLTSRNPARRGRLLAQAAWLKRLLVENGWRDPVATPAPIISAIPRSPRAARRVSDALRAAGIYPSLIHYPGGPGTGYFRFAISSEHNRDQLRNLATVLLDHLRDFQARSGA